MLNDKQIAAVIAEMPRKYRKMARNAMAGLSRVCAIQLHCLKCCQWKREDVRNCTDNQCFLFSYRPYRISPCPEKADLARAESQNNETTGKPSGQNQPRGRGQFGAIAGFALLQLNSDHK